jgi:hypothetical protein
LIPYDTDVQAQEEDSDLDLFHDTNTWEDEEDDQEDNGKSADIEYGEL